MTITSTLATPSGVHSVSVVEGSGGIANVFVFGKYISLLDTKVVAGGRSAMFKILSCEVVRVQIPANVIPTTIQNVDGETQYIEIYLSTPSGISNSILIPYDAGAPPKERGYNVTTDSEWVDIFYQWLTGADQKTNLVASALPGTKNLKRLQDITTGATVLPASVVFNLRVQPWLPVDSEGLRVRTEPNDLKVKVKVNLHYTDTGQNALPEVKPADFPAPPPPTTPSDGTSQLAPSNSAATVKLSTQLPGDRDPAVVRTSQQLPKLRSFLTTPQQPPTLAMPPLLTPNMTSEAEQVARMLTGQPLPANTRLPSSLPNATGINQSVSALARNIAAQPATGQASNILVNPSPVIVVAHPPADTKKPQQQRHSNSDLHKMMESLGNRISQALPNR